MKLYVVTELCNIDEENHIEPEQYKYNGLYNSFEDALMYIYIKDRKYVKETYFIDNPKVELNFVVSYDKAFDMKEIYRVNTKYSSYNDPKEPIEINRYIVIQETIDK